jgi:hypothetical protein
MESLYMVNGKGDNCMTINCYYYYIKLGRTGDIDQRITTLQTASPLILRLIGKYECKDCVTLEKKIHDYYKEKRIIGEWFKFTKLDITECEKMIKKFIVEIHQKMDENKIFEELCEVPAKIENDLAPINNTQRKKYECDVCNKIFKQKSHYDYHINRKFPCKNKNLYEDSMDINQKKSDGKIDDNKIDDNKIDDDKIDDAKIDDAKIDDKINDDKINDDKINDNKINDDKIVDDKKIITDEIDKVNEVDEIDGMVISINKSAKKHKCEYCEYPFTRSDSLNKHLAGRCKVKKQLDNQKEDIFLKISEEINMLKKQNEESQKEINMLKKQNEELRKTQHKNLNKNPQILNYTINNINNCTINNNI